MTTSAIHKDKSSIDEMFRQSLKYKNSDEYQLFFSYVSKFNHYSRYNTMLVCIRNPAVTFFGSPGYWKNKFGMQIKADGKPLIILAPNGPIILAYDVFDTTGKKTANEFFEEGSNAYTHIIIALGQFHRKIKKVSSGNKTIG